MIADYLFKDGPRSARKKQETSGSFGFNSSQFSHKNNNSVNGQEKNMDPSFFNQSSIRQLHQNESGEFIYFQNDSMLSQLKLQLKAKKNLSFNESQKQKKKKESINYSKEIQFEDSLQKSINHDESRLKEYGTGKSSLPPTLKKPKFGFKISQTAESSAIIKDAEPSIVANEVNEEYQLKTSDKKPKLLKNNKEKQVSNHSIHHENSKRSINNNSLNRNENSISTIKGPHKQPSIVSKSLSASSSANGSMNFRSVFRNKVEKASLINSSLTKNHKNVKSSNSILSHKEINKSLSRKDLMDKEVKMAELKDLRELENKLGELKHQNKKIIEYMIDRDRQIEQLKKKKIQIQAEDPYAVIKENQLMKAFLQAKTKKCSKKLDEQKQFGYKKSLHSTKSLKEITLKKSSQISSLHDYDIKEHKFKVDVIPLTKTEKKFILSNRGMVLSEKFLDVGYSLKDKFLTLYLTLKKEYDEVRIKLEENSFILSEVIDRAFHHSEVGKQIKFKTEIKSTKCKNPSEQLIAMCLKISLSSQQKFQQKTNQFKVDLPITVYNIAKQLDIYSNTNLSQKTLKTSQKQTFKTQTFVACKEMARDPQSYLLKLFPTGSFYRDENAFQFGFVWKEKQDMLRIRIKEKSFVIEGEGNPNQGTFELLRSIVSLLIQQKKQQS